MDMTARNRLSGDRLHQLKFLNCNTAVSRRFLERLGLTSVTSVRLVSVLRVWENGTSRSRLGLESLKQVAQLSQRNRAAAWVSFGWP